jgi:chromosome segregation ATPase
MSTAGKVLVSLILLVVPVWIVLISSVAELNKSGGEQVANLKTKVEQLEADLISIQKNIVELKDQISLEQETMAEQLTLFREHQTELQKSRSETAEMVSRVKLQLGTMQEAARRAEADRDVRKAEQAQEQVAKGIAEGAVEKLKQEHAGLVEELDKLRNEFKGTFESNRQLLGRLRPTRTS